MELLNWVDREPLVLPLGLTDGTPEGRRRIALVFLGLAIGVLLTIPHVQPQMAWPRGLLVAACLLVALRFGRESRLPVYLQDPVPIVDVWEITPGEGIGPLRLGPPDHETIRLLRKSAVIMERDRIVTCLLRHANGWTAVVARTRTPASKARAPDPGEYTSIERVMTTSPAHLTPTGVRVGDALPDATAALGVPAEVPGPLAAPRCILRWPGGLNAGLQGNHIAWVGVFADARAGMANDIPPVEDSRVVLH